LDATSSRNPEGGTRHVGAGPHSPHRFGKGQDDILVHGNGSDEEGQVFCERPEVRRLRANPKIPCPSIQVPEAPVRRGSPSFRWRGAVPEGLSCYLAGAVGAKELALPLSRSFIHVLNGVSDPSAANHREVRKDERCSEFCRLSYQAAAVPRP
jgi:hypothetical protein